MQKLVCILVLIPSIVFANPFVVSDPSQDGATHYQIEMDGTLVETFEGDTVNFDLVDIAPGDHVLRAKFCKQWQAEAGDVVYECGDFSLPFAFTRPEKSAIPGGIRIGIK